MKTNVFSLDDIAITVNRSSFVNVPQLVGDLDGTVHIPSYNWSNFFEDHMIKIALKGISQLHQFGFSATHPGIVFVKTSSDGKECSIQLLKDPTWKPTASQLPPVSYSS